MKDYLIYLGLFLLFASPLKAVQFETGNQFTATLLRGEVFVICEENGMRETNDFVCQDMPLSPAEYAGLVTESPFAADSVTVTSTWEDGTIRKKTGSYNAQTKKSEHFNLWISTLFQRPLLNFGNNKIHYEFSKSGQVTQTGDFSATVDYGPTLSCPYQTMYSYSLFDCRTSTTICSQYFNEYGNQCR